MGKQKERLIMKKILEICGYIGAVVLGFITLFFYGKKEGKKEEQSEQIKEEVKSGIETKKTIDKLHNVEPMSIDEFLRKDARD
jgi:hypothetical protein